MCSCYPIIVHFNKNAKLEHGIILLVHYSSIYLPLQILRWRWRDLAQWHGRRSSYHHEKCGLIIAVVHKIRAAYMNVHVHHVCTSCMYMYFMYVHVLHECTCTSCMYMYFMYVHVLHECTCTSCMYMYFM